MIANDRIRMKAWSIRLAVGFMLNAPVPALDIISALEEYTGLLVLPLPANDPLLCGAQAVLDLSIPAIYQDDDQDSAVKLFNSAHEFGHWYFHHGGANDENCACEEHDLDVDSNDNPTLPSATVLGYSSRERRETEANIFASELLFPLPLALHCFNDLHWTVGKICDELCLSAAIVRRQLTDAVLLPLPNDSAEPQPLAPAMLDTFQHAAACAEEGPLLLSAGPGTGKTKTLVGRCLYLTNKRDVRPEKIAALTFSRKAAAEMYDRLHLAGVTRGYSGPWVGTFHSFGMELLRKYGERIGLTQDFKLIDQMDSVTLLENNLPRLNLVHLASVRNPAQHLSGILNKIKRAKDELRSPRDYAQLAQQMSERATKAIEEIAQHGSKLLKKDEKQIAKIKQDVARVLEVSHAYFVYEELLRSNNFVDFADLIVRAVELLETCSDIRDEQHRRYPYVLADEYQDVNRASAKLLRLMVTDEAQGLWVVGDHRQSIYQFQGASPANVSRFRSDYPNGSLHELKVNYRSVKEIVDTFGAAAGSLSFGSISDGPTDWSAHRGRSILDTCASELTVVGRSWDQYVHVSDRIRRLAAEGVGYSEQVILCRKHSQAQEAASSLKKLGIPTLYIGQVLERREIKDLIALVSACAAGQSAAVVRALQMKEYGLSAIEALEGARELLRSSEGESNETLNGTGLFAVNLLKSHLSALAPFVDRPSTLLRTYIFEVSGFLGSISSANSSFDAVLSKIAIKQFIDIVDGFDKRAVAPAEVDAPNRCVKLLAYLRRLTSIGAASSLPDSDAIDQIDAVRVMTIHAAKGLEFRSVFMLDLNEGQFPSRSPHDGIPDVPGLSLVEETDADEEECLFFVGLSRARDAINVVRYAMTENGSEVKPSSLLSSLDQAIERGAMTLTDCSTTATNESIFEAADREVGGEIMPIFSASELELYERCPRRYYYEKVQMLRGAEGDDGYFRLRKLVTELVDWVEERAASGLTTTKDMRLEKLNEIWPAAGLAGHLHEALYRAEAEQVADVDPPDKVAASTSLTMTAKLRNALVHVKPDKVTINDGVILATRRIFGKSGDGDHTDKKLALFRKAATDTFPELKAEVILHCLGDGGLIPVAESARYEPARLAKYEDAVTGILSEKFECSPRSKESCGSCPFIFVCPRRGNDDQ